MKDIKIAVKYCGGCNPYYDRKQAAYAVEAEFNTKLKSYDEENYPDITLIICGCKSECIDISKYKSRYKTVVINHIEGLDDAVREIKNSIPE